jgi:hypothetical protein
VFALQDDYLSILKAVTLLRTLADLMNLKVFNIAVLFLNSILFLIFKYSFSDSVEPKND